jgi:hypothetical protein
MYAKFTTVLSASSSSAHAHAHAHVVQYWCTTTLVVAVAVSRGAYVRDRALARMATARGVQPAHHRSHAGAHRDLFMLGTVVS